MRDSDGNSYTAVQNVTATAGFAYGTIGADIHVFGDGRPVYVLKNYQEEQPASTSWLRALPSRMLNARFAVVDFNGRSNELAELHGWCQMTHRLSAKWLYGPGGHGKTRLAYRFIGEVMSQGWKVVVATPGQGTIVPPPGSQDMRTNDARGILLLVDYADRWPKSHLEWLFSNALFHRNIPTRLLLLARTNSPWRALSSTLEEHMAETAPFELQPLSCAGDLRERYDMFTAARNSFARHYFFENSSDVEHLTPPATIASPELGSILTIHMAALVAVDAYANDQVRPPADIASLTSYLLHRERKHWTTLYEGRLKGIEYASPPSTMSRAVLTSALLGPVTASVGIQAIQTALGDLALETPAQRLIIDHALLYPAADEGYILEPMYPDRLAEDFLALSLPGHGVADEPAESWSVDVLFKLISLASRDEGDLLLSRSLGLLAEAASRWEHLIRPLSYVLTEAPGVAFRAGGATLVSIANLDSISTVALLKLGGAAPPPVKSRRGIDLGVALICQRAINDVGGAEKDQEFRAVMYTEMALRYANEKMFDEAIEAGRRGVAEWQSIATSDISPENLNQLANALANQSRHLAHAGFRNEALDSANAALDARAKVVTKKFFRDARLSRMYLSTLAMVGVRYYELGMYRDALRDTKRAVSIIRLYAGKFPSQISGTVLAESLDALSAVWVSVGKFDKAIEIGWEAITVARAAVAADSDYEERLLKYLLDYCFRLHEIAMLSDDKLTSLDYALDTAEQAVSITRRFAEKSNSWQDTFYRASALYGIFLAKQQNRPQSSLALRDALSIFEPKHQVTSVAYRACAEVFIASSKCMSLVGNATDLAVSQAESAVGASRRELSHQIEFIRFPNIGSANKLLATSLAELADRQIQAGRYRDAIGSESEAIQILRQMVDDRTPSSEVHLAAALRRLGHHFRVIGRAGEASQFEEESASVMKQLAR
ncbi:hypothetical protein [Nocardia fluminea]|uniref:hypothetical protein n=1 Tax=Nocardia fluminea TaxID=134984 RepID=UPI003D0DEE54